MSGAYKGLYDVVEDSNYISRIKRKIDISEVDGENHILRSSEFAYLKYLKRFRTTFFGFITRKAT